MADSYIDLNVEHYLRNGELKGAVKELNTIINGEGSNKSLTELVEDLKVALNYANWGYWWENSLIQGGDKENVKPLKEAVKRAVSETAFTFQAEVPFVKRGSGDYYYIDVDKVIKEMEKERSIYVKTIDFNVEISIDDRWCSLIHKINGGVSEKDNWEKMKYKVVEEGGASRGIFKIEKTTRLYKKREDIPKTDGLYEVGYFIFKASERPEKILVRLSGSKVTSCQGRGDKHDLFNEYGFFE